MRSPNNCMQYSCSDDFSFVVISLFHTLCDAYQYYSSLKQEWDAICNKYYVPTQRNEIVPQKRNEVTPQSWDLFRMQ